MKQIRQHQIWQKRWTQKNTNRKIKEAFNKGQKNGLKANRGSMRFMWETSRENGATTTTTTTTTTTKHGG